MKEVCGFKDSKGNFHEKLKAAELANAKYKLKEAENCFYHFELIIEKFLRENYPIVMTGGDISVIENQMYKCLSHTVLINFDKLKQIMDTKQDLEKDLDLMRKQYRHAKLAIRSKWWVRLKWW